MILKEVRVRYRQEAGTGKPHYLNNEDIRGIAASVRRQLLPDPDAHRLTSDRLLGIETIAVNGIRLGVSWSTDYPVTGDRDEPVLGVCEYDHQGMPDTALVSVNADLTRDNEGLRLGTLAHEFAHAVFEVPSWRAIARQTDAFADAEEQAHRVFRTVTVDEEHLTVPAGRAVPGQFSEWRANEFMGSLVVPKDLLADRLRHHALALGIPLETESGQGWLFFARKAFRIAADIDGGRYALQIALLLSNLADDFGVSLRFVKVRLLRYGLATSAQLEPG